jgi:hypothetical protein
MAQDAGSSRLAAPYPGETLRMPSDRQKADIYVEIGKSD